MSLHRTRNNRMISRRLEQSSRRILPLFERITSNRAYAARLVGSIQAGRLNTAQRLILRVVPGASVSLGAGFEAAINFRNPTQTFGFGIFRPGRMLRTSEVRQVARILLPMITRFGNSPMFRLRIIRLFRQGRTTAILRALRIVSGSSRLISLGIDDYGFFAVVQLPNGARYNAIFTIAI